MSKWKCPKCGHNNKDSETTSNNSALFLVGACGAGFVFGAGGFMVVFLIAVMSAITGTDGGASSATTSKKCKNCGSIKVF